MEYKEERDWKNVREYLEKKKVEYSIMEERIDVYVQRRFIAHLRNLQKKPREFKKKQSEAINNIPKLYNALNLTSEKRELLVVLSTLEDVRTRGVDSDAVRMYVVQLQHQMLVADAKRGWLVFYDGPNDDLVEFEFERDEELVGQIVNEGRAFHALVETKTEPPKDPDEDVFIPETDEDRECWVRAALDFLSIDADIRRHQEEIRLLQERREAAQETFKRIMGDNACAEYAGVAVTRSVVKGRVNAEKLFEAALSRRPTEAELAACRSPDTERWLFRATGRDVPKDFADEQLARETAELREETTGSFYF